MSKTSYLCVVMLHFECPVCQPNFYRSAVFSAEFCSFRKNLANRNNSRKFVQPAELKQKIRLMGLCVCVALHCNQHCRLLTLYAAYIENTNFINKKIKFMKFTEF